MRRAVKHYQAEGFSIALDDLGSGYSSLRLWSEVHPDFVKIDRHFINGIEKDRVKRDFVRSIIDIARSVNSQVIAEGIETLQEFETLSELGVDYLQGYYFAKPSPIPAQQISKSAQKIWQQVKQSREIYQELEQIGQLKLDVSAIAPDQCIEEVVSIFESNEHWHSLPVVADGVVIGVIRRSQLLQTLSKPFGHDLYVKKAVRQVLDDKFISVERHTRLEVVSQLVVQRNRQQPAVFRSMLGISWMWFFGAVFLSQFPSFSKEVLHANEQVASLLLVVFSIGIAIGSLLCETLSRRQVEIGLVPLGAIGMSVFSIDLYFATRCLPDSAEMGITAFVQHTAHWRVLIDLLALSMFAGLYSVPMYALIQMRTEKTHTARIIAANNILNALFMIASSLLAAALLAYGLSIAQVFLVVGVLNALVTFYIFMLVPEYFLRFISWLLSHLIYRFKVTNKQVIPSEGAVILTCNHVSFIDAVLLMAASPRPIYYIMDHRIFKIPVLGWIFKLAKAIPIAAQKEDPVAYEKAFQQAAQVLRNGDVLAIFPEGAITRNGELGEFKAGLLKILQTAHADGLPVPVIPMGLKNLWGSYFSRVDGAAMSKPFRRGLWSRVGLNIGEPIPGEQVTMDGLKQQVQVLINQE